MAECGVASHRWGPDQRPWLTEVILGVGELRVRVALGELRDRQAHRPITSNDLRDIDALGAAIPNCAVVVTEKFWTALARQAQLEEHFGTRIIGDLRGLPGTLHRMAPLDFPD
jgi:hypothetical protein